MATANTQIPASDFPVPEADADSRPFWSAVNEEKFLIQRCDNCGRAQFYFRSICQSCQSSSLHTEASQGKGAIASFSVVHRAPMNCFRAWGAYPVALVDLDEGIRFLTNVVQCDPAEVRIGQRVELVFEQIPGSDQKLPKVTLA